MTASTNVNWEGSSTDVERDKTYYNCGSLELILIVSIKLVRASLIFFSVKATFSSLFVSFLDMFVASSFFFLFFLLCIHVHANLKTNTKLTYESKYKTHV